MKFSILCVGKIKESFYRDAVAEYAKRLSRYGKLEILEVADEKTPDEPSEAQRLQILKKDVDATVCSTNIAKGFIGPFVGMYTSSNGKESHHKAIFDWFDYKGL